MTWKLCEFHWLFIMQVDCGSNVQKFVVEVFPWLLMGEEAYHN